jgi:hypothetical protein
MVATTEQSLKERIISQRPELKYSSLFKVRQGLIIAETMHKVIKVFKEKGDVFECVQELNIKGCQSFSLLDLASENAIIIAEGYVIKKIPYLPEAQRYDEGGIELLHKASFVVTEMIELQDGSVIASFGSHDRERLEWPMSIVYGPQKKSAYNTSRNTEM